MKNKEDPAQKLLDYFREGKKQGRALALADVERVWKEAFVDNGNSPLNEKCLIFEKSFIKLKSLNSPQDPNCFGTQPVDSRKGCGERFNRGHSWWDCVEGILCPSCKEKKE